MLRRLNPLPFNLRNEKGFTLIEMAIVLIIIGIIIGAVVKGKDVMKSAEQKRLYNTFVREWQVAYNNYYDRTGWILGDDVDAANTTRNGQCGNGGLAPAASLDAQLRNVGLTPPAPGSTGATNVRTYTDSNGNQYTLTLTFDYDADIGNFIQLNGPNGVPIDLGLSWDRILDGTADGTTGDLQYDNNGAPGATQQAWPSASAPAPNGSHIYLLLDF
jgi:prepilin-type N-terminal cleavage/methylation domain-containing protein